MQIAGLQKLTLLDYPGKIACTVFTAGCNFHCPFCQNSSLLSTSAPEFISEEDFFTFLESRKHQLEGVAITGGEPLIHTSLIPFMQRIKDLGFNVKLDTNGSSLLRLKVVVEAGLVDRVAMDIKDSPEFYAETAGWSKDFLSEVEQSKDYLLQNHVEYEFRTTVVKGIHTEERLKSLALWISGASEYYLQQFSGRGDVLNPEGLGSFSDEEMKHLLEVVQEIIPVAQLRGVS